MPAIARVILAVLSGGALLSLAVLGGMAFWVWRRGGFGVVASALLRSLAAVVVGLGGWFLAILVVASWWPERFASAGLAVVASGVAVGLCVYLAWTRRDASPPVRYGGLAGAVAWGLAGAWLGGQAIEGMAGGLTAILGAVLAANLAVLVVDVGRARSGERLRGRRERLADQVDEWHLRVLQPHLVGHPDGREERGGQQPGAQWGIRPVR